jgi:hypothetical protein
LAASAAALGLLLAALGSTGAAASPDEDEPVTIRTETYRRLSYSDATYFIYERDGETVCTKLVVCNHYTAACRTVYARGAFRAYVDLNAGAPTTETTPVAIPQRNLIRHICLRRFALP